MFGTTGANAPRRQRETPTARTCARRGWEELALSVSCADQVENGGGRRRAEQKPIDHVEDRGGHVPATKKIPNAVPEFIGLRPLAADANFTSDAFSYGDCLRCGMSQLQLVLVPQKMFGEVVPPDVPL